ncbi:hypothetical protein COF74_27100 [Bacillus wiedmannii]|nr:hypothetical protein COF74_27100 [Bacillus wiedmannii]
MKEFINYRKTGLSLNHIIGCPLNCGYCVRHFWGNFDVKKPQLLCSDDEALEAMLNHPFFIPDVTPIQIFNKATDPFLPSVKPHLFYILKKMDELGYENIITIITRYKVTEEDVYFLESLKNIKITLFFTYSGIKDTRIEPIQSSGITVQSIKRVNACRTNLKTILYWRPLVPGWNDDEETMLHVLDVSKHVDAIVFTGYYHKKENAEHLSNLGVEIPYENYQRRKILPLDLDKKVIEIHRKSGVKVPLFRKTSCAATFVHNLPDYNGHWGVRELCNICPVTQQKLCNDHHNKISDVQIAKLLKSHPINSNSNHLIEDGHIWTEKLGEEKRYYLQHSLGYQVWDIDLPHFKSSHGRSSIGQAQDKNWYNKKRKEFYQEVMYEDD